MLIYSYLAHTGFSKYTKSRNPLLCNTNMRELHLLLKMIVRY